MIDSSLLSYLSKICKAYDIRIIYNFNVEKCVHNFLFEKYNFVTTFKINAERLYEMGENGKHFLELKIEEAAKLLQECKY